MTKYRVEGDRLVTGAGAVPFVEATAYDRKSRITPRVIVLHDTAGWLTRGNAVNWFKSAKCTTSAHLVQEYAGDFVQMVEFDQRAYHAGKSSFKGKSEVNYYGIGIEITNPGVLSKAGKAWFHKKVADYFSPADIVQKTTKAHGPGYWLPYPEAQVEEIIEVCRALVKRYPTIKDITTHWEISPGRKVDCNPLFPLERVRAAVFNEAVVPTPVANNNGYVTIQFGSDGERVKRLQERLQELRYVTVGAADGLFGSRTRMALLAFEAENGLPSDGVLSENDYNVLNSAAAKAMPVPAAVTSSAADLALSGSRIASATQFGKKLITRVLVWTGLTTTGDAILTGGEGATALLDTADKARNLVTRSTDMLGFLKSDLGLALFVMVVLAGGVWFLLDQIEKARVDDARKGKTATA